MEMHMTPISVGLSETEDLVARIPPTATHIRYDAVTQKISESGEAHDLHILVELLDNFFRRYGEGTAHITSWRLEEIAA